MSSSKKIARGVFWTTLLNLVNGVYGFISVPLLIGYFGKSDYGLIGLAISINVYLGLMDLGFNSTNVRFFSNWLAKKELNNVKNLFQTSLSFYGTIGLINGVILLIISLFSKEIFDLPAEQDLILKNLFYILSISAIISWFTSCFDQLIRACEYVGWLQKMMLLPKMVQILILGCTIWCELSIEVYYGMTAFSMFLIIPFAIYKIKKIAPFISFIPKFNKAIFKEILPYCLNIFSFGFFQFSINYLRPVFLGMQGNIESVADYRILNGIITIVLMLGGAFLGVILPSASKVVALGDKQAQDRIAYDGTKYIAIILCFCCFGMMTVSSNLLTLYVGAEYLHLTVWLNIWLLSTTLLHNQAISSLILAGSNIRAITYATISSSIVGLLLCWFLIPHYEVGGTVIAYAAYCLLQLLFYYLYYWPKRMSIHSGRVFKSSYMPPFICGALCMISARWITSLVIPNEQALYSLLVGGCLFGILYASASYIIVLNRRDKEFFLKFISKPKS